MNEIVINHSLKKNGLTLYKFPITNGGERLSAIYVEGPAGEIINLDLDLTEVEFELLEPTAEIRQVFSGYSGSITARYSK